MAPAERPARPGGITFERSKNARRFRIAPVFANPLPEDVLWLAEFPEDRKKKAVRKLFSFIDRINIGNANIEGMSDSLGLTGTQFNVALSIFFIPYLLLQGPGNGILNKCRKRPSLGIGSMVIAFGTMTAVLGVVRNVRGLFAARFMLGVTEAGFSAAPYLIISKWYNKNEAQTRLALIYKCDALAGAFSGLLAFAIAKMDGVGSYESWRWIFILEGLATVLVSIATYFCLIDSPKTSTKWLDPDEIQYLYLRKLAESGNETRQADDCADACKLLRSIICNWQIYVQALVYWSSTVPNTALTFTMPRILRNMGYTSSHAQLLTIGPYCAGAVTAYLSAVFAGRFTWCMPFIVGPQLVVVSAYGILLGLTAESEIQKNIPACFFAVVLACIGLYPINEGGRAWTRNNLAGPAKRAFGSGYVRFLGHLGGGIVGSFIFIEDESPKYPTGFGTSLGFAAAGFGACLVLETGYHFSNKRKSRMSEEEIRAKYTEEELEVMGDKSPLFRYTL
ncbi:hypothetical protein ACJZ2D_003378 [Fusarium nematophilum]